MFGEVVDFAVEDHAEAFDGVFDVDELAFEAGEGFGDEEGLREEALDAADDEFVLFAEFFHAEDGDDVLEFVVALQHLLDALGCLVVFLADDVGGEDA